MTTISIHDIEDVTVQDILLKRNQGHKNEKWIAVTRIVITDSQGEKTELSLFSPNEYPISIEKISK